MTERDKLNRRIAEIAGDNQSGASDLTVAAIAVLRDALDARLDLVPIATALCHAQPAMAPIWNAALHALAGRTTPERFALFEQRLLRSSDALARFALGCLTDDGDSTLRIATLSCSRSVLQAITAVQRTRPVEVVCAESRPGLEGRRLAALLAALGIPVVCYADAAMAESLVNVDVVVVGADAVAPTWFLNKCGTRMLCSAATLSGVPVYVVAARDKFVMPALAARLEVNDGRPDDVWSDPPPGVTTRNPIFERTSLDLITSVISDTGVLGAGMIADVCEAFADPELMAALAEIG